MGVLPGEDATFRCDGRKVERNRSPLKQPLTVRGLAKLRPKPTPPVQGSPGRRPAG